MRAQAHEVRSWWKLMVLVLVMATVLPLLSAPASGQTSFQVTVKATSTYGSGPGFFYELSPRLPSGWTAEGNVWCDRVRVNGVERRVSDVYPTLGAGAYLLRGCGGDVGYPLVIRNPQNVSMPITYVQNSNFVSWTVRKTQTAVGMAILETVPGRLDLTAVVSLLEQEFGSVDGGSVTAMYETAGGYHQELCRKVTTTLPGGTTKGIQCSVDKAAVLAGTGTVLVSYEGDANNGASSTQVRLEGALTAPEVAAQALQRYIDGNTVQVEITEHRDSLPGNCHPPGSVSTASLITVSLRTLSCDQVKALQYTTKIVFAISTAVMVGGNIYLAAQTAAQEAAWKAAALAVAAG